uniref:Uncharacterized protein n=1 Tax=Arundo donax TaxID=35708 RepID=A0A0A9E374_ARUDO
MNASPAPTSRNCGVSRNTLMGSGPGRPALAAATARRFFSETAAATMPAMERTRPMPIFSRLVNPCLPVMRLRQSGTKTRS